MVEAFLASGTTDFLSESRRINHGIAFGCRRHIQQHHQRVFFAVRIQRLHEIAGFWRREMSFHILGHENAGRDAGAIVVMDFKRAYNIFGSSGCDSIGD